MNRLIQRDQFPFRLCLLVIAISNVYRSRLLLLRSYHCKVLVDLQRAGHMGSLTKYEIILLQLSRADLLLHRVSTNVNIHMHLVCPQ